MPMSERYLEIFTINNKLHTSLLIISIGILLTQAPNTWYTDFSYLKLYAPSNLKLSYSKL